MTTINIKESRDKLLPPIALATLKDRYMLPEETSPQQAFARAALAYADDEAHAQRIYDYVSQGWFMFATPILSNGGTNKGLPISCFGGYVPDSRKGLLDHYTENAWLSSMGGGIGGYWGGIRGNGAKIKNGGTSTGVIPFIKVVDSEMLAFSQGSTRRGSYAAYLDISHPEIVEFINMRKPTGGDMNRKSLNLHHAVVIPDEFMEKVKSGDSWNLLDPHSGEVVDTVDARQLWSSILTMRVETGEPYIMWGDTCNAALPEALRNQGLKIHQSNLCVAPETQVLTRNGYKRIDILDNINIDVWNGMEWSNTRVHKTNEQAELVRVTFSDGSVLECTPYHNFYIQQSYNKNDVVIKPTTELVVGDILEKWELPIDSNVGGIMQTTLHNAYSQGFYSGDGNKNSDYSWLYAPKYVCADRLCGTLGGQHDSVDRKTWKHGVMEDKSFVPYATYNMESRLNWLAGLLDADGTVVKSDNRDILQLASVDLTFLQRLKLMLSELGVHSKISIVSVPLLPNRYPITTTTIVMIVTFTRV